MSFLKYPILDNWDNIEVHPLGFDKENGVNYIIDNWDEVTKLDVWVVYVHLVVGGIDEICEFYTKEDAFKFANKIQNLVNTFKRTEFTDFRTFKP